MGQSSLLHCRSNLSGTRTVREAGHGSISSQKASFAAPFLARSAAALASTMTSFTLFSASGWLMPVCAAMTHP